MNKFSYLSNKVREADFSTDPFRHIIIDKFFKDEHFDRIVNSEQIKTPRYSSHRDVVNGLVSMGYEPQPFPGSITNIEKYLEFTNGETAFDRNLIDGYGKYVIEGYGLTMRLNKCTDAFLNELIEYLNGAEFQTALKSKFAIDEPVEIETAYQKNLMHYEISPHCDTSKKALTYMVNIYNVDDCSNRDMHTHLLRFKPQYRYLYEVWKYNEFDPIWVPWQWCETVKKTRTNNSISIFRPSFDTLHAVKITEPHFSHQRNQIYGNLWYPSSKKKGDRSWQQLDLINDSRPCHGRFRKSAVLFAKALKTLLAG